ncbi:MAG TPA: efflux RND transporter periplasmic adaptor subunit [Bryobacteraceae bacterium]|nr:efflux RND transporter periplasmic adaptor subunit [Bryobacteraceae bacterium]
MNFTIPPTTQKRAPGRAVYLSFALAMVVLSGCNSSTANASADSGKKGKGRGGGAGGAVPVVVATAVQRDVPIEIQAVGTVEAYKTISVKSQIAGQITDIYFNEGDYVKAGDKLFRIDPRLYEAQLAQAQANKEKSVALEAQAEANLEHDIANQKYAALTADRTEALVKEGIASRDQGDQLRANANALTKAVEADRAAIESAKAQILADQANIDNIKVQLSYTIIPSPLDGRTGNVEVKLGNTVAPLTVELVTINEIEPIYVTFAVPEARLADIKRYSAAGNLPVIARPQDGSNEVEQGVLTFIDNSVDTTTGTIKLKGTFQNKDRKLWPGQFLNVTLRLTTQPNAVTVPNQAVQNGQDGQFIYVVKPDRTVEARNVEIGSRVDQDLVILKGIDPGETVVTEGQLRLQPGSRVQMGEGRRGGGRDAGQGGGNGGKGRSG